VAVAQRIHSMLGGAGGYYSSDDSYDFRDVGATLYPEPPKPNGPMPDYCATIASNGLPDDCTRTYAMFSAPLNPLNGFPFESPQLSWWLNWAEKYQLGNCYSNPINDPTECELGMAQTITNMRDFFNPGGSPDSDGIYPWDPYETFNLAIEAYQNMSANASTNRWLASWFGPGIGVSAGPFEVNVNVNIFQSALLSDRLNTYFVESRKKANCKVIIEKFDQEDCGRFFAMPNV
jgi:hypothetical protein